MKEGGTYFLAQRWSAHGACGQGAGVGGEQGLSLAPLPTSDISSPLPPQVASSNGAGTGTFTYTNPAAGSDNL